MIHPQVFCFFFVEKKAAEPLGLGVHKKYGYNKVGCPASQSSAMKVSWNNPGDDDHWEGGQPQTIRIYGMPPQL